MSNLVKELNSVSRKRRSQMSAASALTQSQRLIADKGAEDMETLRAMGMHHSIVRAQNIRGAQMELEQLEAKYGKIFTFEEIEKMACKYALKFLRTDCYKGNVDPVMLQKMKEFFADAGIEMNKAKLGYDFFILAPSKAFNLKETPKPPKRDPDPVLFYRIDDKHYRMIHKWGRDLTMSRRFVGFKYMNSFTYFLVWMTFMFVPSFALVNFITPKFTWWSLLVLLPSVIISLVRVGNDQWGGTFKDWKKSFTTTVKAKF